MSGATRITFALWDWEPFMGLSVGARVLWLALYTTAPAKRLPPGLWHGGLSALAEAARISHTDAIEYLRELLDRGVAETDHKLSVTRLTSLPDDGEKPANGRVLRSWWTKFGTIPACAVRDAHIEVLRWLTPKTEDHAKVWAETFGSVRPLTVSRKRVPTSSPQGVLFDSADMRNGIGYRQDPDTGSVSGSEGEGFGERGSTMPTVAADGDRPRVSGQDARGAVPPSDTPTPIVIGPWRAAGALVERASVLPTDAPVQPSPPARRRL